MTMMNRDTKPRPKPSLTITTNTRRVLHSPSIAHIMELNKLEDRYQTTTHSIRPNPTKLTTTSRFKGDLQRARIAKSVRFSNENIVHRYCPEYDHISRISNNHPHNSQKPADESTLPSCTSKHCEHDHRNCPTKSQTCQST